MVEQCCVFNSVWAGLKAGRFFLWVWLISSAANPLGTTCHLLPSCPCWMSTGWRHGADLMWWEVRAVPCRCLSLSLQSPFLPFLELYLLFQCKKVLHKQLASQRWKSSLAWALTFSVSSWVPPSLMPSLIPSAGDGSLSQSQGCFRGLLLAKKSLC